MRIEDTDLERSAPEYELEIMDSLSWLGLAWEEGIDVGGTNGPYRQTDRLEIYKGFAEKLLAEGHAYHCFCTEEELEEERRLLLEQGQIIKYSGKCRGLSQEEKDSRVAQGIRPTVRFQVGPGCPLTVHDLVRGEVVFSRDEVGDFIIVKSDGIPTYNFAVVVDDHQMGITHVIRAEEHLSNTPRQLVIYEALGFEIPEFAHISLIMGHDGQKMSKRHGATSLIQYREEGYLPAAVFNFLALMGWSPEGEEELLPAEEIIRQFSLNRVAKKPAVFDLDKLNWINAQYIKRTTLNSLGEMLRPFTAKSAYSGKIDQLNEERYQVLVEALQDRLVCLGDVVAEVEAFFAAPIYDNEARDLLKTEEVQMMLAGFLEELPDQMSLEVARNLMKSLPKAVGLPGKKVFMPLRIALTGHRQGPDLPYLMTVIGAQELRERVLQHLDKG